MQDRLQRRPEARAQSVEDLLEQVNDGRVRVPRFQRTLRWRGKEVIALFDSIYRGFPIGELLLWRREAPEDVLRFGTVTIEAEARDDALFVVDGQQRITALAATLLDRTDAPRGDIYAVWFDLETERFQRSTVAAPPTHWIPLNRVLDSTRLLQWLHDWPLKREREDLVSRALALGKAIREFRIPSYVVRDATEETLRLIFKRVNTAGVSMTEAEVFDAISGKSDVKPAQDASRRLSEVGFGPFGAKWFVGALKAVAGIDPRRRFTEDERRLDDSQIDATESALRHAIRFLVSDAGIPHSDLLPYRLPLVVLARFFHLHPDPTPRNRLLLRRWIWRGALSGVHANNSNATMRRLIHCIDRDQACSVQNLLAQVPREWDMPDLRATWNFRYAATKLAALALLSLEPQDPVSHEAVHLDSNDGVTPDGDRHPRPREFFVPLAPGRNPPIAGVVVTRPRKDAAAAARRALARAPSDVLASHAIDGPALRALRDEDWSTFARSRERELEARFDSFLRERAADSESDRPAIDELLRPSPASSAPTA